MANKYVKRCSTSLVIRETQNETPMKPQYTPIRMSKILKTNHTKCWQGCGTAGNFIH